MKTIKVVVDSMPEISEECPFGYDQIERRTPVWCREGYDVPVDYCGFSNAPCTLSEEGCEHLLSLKQLSVR